MNHLSIIQKCILQLLKEEPFYAHFFLNSHIIYDRWKVERAAVAVINSSPVFIFNTAWMESLPVNHAQEVIKHEILHLVLQHLIEENREKTEDRTVNGKEYRIDKHQIKNIATDCAINQYLKNLPENCVTLEGVSKMVEEELEPFQTSDYYFGKLMQKADKVMQDIADGKMGTLDEHDLEIPGDQKGELRNGIISRVTKEATNKAAGNVPDAIRKALDAFQTPQISWQNILRNFVATHVSRKVKYTKKKLDRRFALPAPGKTRIREMVLGVCADSSGSVSDAQFASFLSEIKVISKTISKTWMIHADCEVQSVEDLSKMKLEFVRKGNGGTAYQPAIDKCKELKCDAIIYFGDFDCADVPSNPGVPFLWVGVGNQEPPGKFGKVLRIK